MPLRILQITEACAAGVGRHVLDLTEGLLARGHDVALVYSGRRMDEPFSRRAFSMDGLRTHRIDMRRSPHVSDAAVLSKLRRYVKTHGPFDVIHGHSSKGGAVARLLGRRGAAPIVYTPHCMYTMNEELGGWTLRLTRAVERQLARWTHAIIAVSPQEREHIVELGIGPQKVQCIVNGVAGTFGLERSAARERLGLPADAVVAGYLGRLSHQKNPLLLLNAFAQVDVPGVRLAIAGTGELQAQAERAASDLGVAGRVHWLGYRSAEEVLPALDVFVLPSRYEGMPYVLLEALGAGLPIVATEVGGARLAVHDGENGFIVPRSSPERLAEAILRLAASPDLRARFQAASRGIAGQFTVERMVDETIAVYDQVLSTSEARCVTPNPCPSRS